MCNDFGRASVYRSNWLKHDFGFLQTYYVSQIISLRGFVLADDEELRVSFCVSEEYGVSGSQISYLFTWLLPILSMFLPDRKRM